MLIVGDGQSKIMKFINSRDQMKSGLVVILLMGALGIGMAQEINWYSIDAGGGISSQNGIQLMGVIGQQDTTKMSADDITLAGGYLPLSTDSDVIFKDTFE